MQMLSGTACEDRSLTRCSGVADTLRLQRSRAARELSRHLRSERINRSRFAFATSGDPGELNRTRSTSSTWASRPGSLARCEQDVLEIEIRVVRPGVRQSAQQLRHRVENHHAMVVIRDLRERDGEVVAVRDLTRRDIGSPQHPVLRIRDVGHNLGRAHTARPQPQRRDQLTKPARGKHKEILVELRHPAAAHVVAHHHAAAPAGQIHGEHGRASDKRNRVGLPRRIIVEAFLLQHARECSPAHAVVATTRAPPTSKRS